MRLTYTHGREFVREARPLVEARDTEALISYLDERWAGDRLRGILETRHDDAVKVALIGLLLKGAVVDVPAILTHLKSEDAYVAGLAEHALWCIWFRASTERNNHALVEAVEALGASDHDKAVSLLAGILARDPEFAEAHNQLAIARFLQGRNDLAVASAREALALVPEHFGALATLGHSYASMGRYARALQYYHQALRIHPRVQGIREAVGWIGERLQRESEDDPNALPTGFKR